MRAPVRKYLGQTARKNEAVVRCITKKDKVALLGPSPRATHTAANAGQDLRHSGVDDESRPSSRLECKTTIELPLLDEVVLYTPIQVKRTCSVTLGTEHATLGR